MLNYNKMDEILNNLDACVNNMGVISETQTKLEAVLTHVQGVSLELENTREAVDAHAQKVLKNLLERIDNLLVDLKQIEGLISEYTETIQNLEKEHDRISRKLEVVLQDYKKIHSAFEYVEIELKKTSGILEELQEEIKLQNIQTAIELKQCLAEAIQKIGRENEQRAEAIKKQNNDKIEQEFTTLKEVNKRNKNFLLGGVLISIGLATGTLLISGINLLLLLMNL